MRIASIHSRPRKALTLSADAARSFACRAETPEPLNLNPLFLDTLYDIATRVPPSGAPTCPSPYTHWMLRDLCFANGALLMLWRTPLPVEELNVLVEALFVLLCRALFRRAARRKAAEREGGVVRKLITRFWRTTGEAADVEE